MISGIGTDICRISRVSEAIERTGAPFLNKFFTRAEIELAGRSASLSTHLAARFAAKEAIFKAFGIGFTRFEGTDIEIGAGELGEPVVSLSGGLAEFAARMGIKKVLVSMSFDGEYATAVSVLER